MSQNRRPTVWMVLKGDQKEITYVEGSPTLRNTHIVVARPPVLPKLSKTPTSNILSAVQTNLCLEISRRFPGGFPSKTPKEAAPKKLRGAGASGTGLGALVGHLEACRRELCVVLAGTKVVAKANYKENTMWAGKQTRGQPW